MHIAEYSLKFDIYLIVFEDFNFYIFDKDIKFMNTSSIDLMFPIGLHYLDDTDTILLIGVHGIITIINRYRIKTFENRHKRAEQIIY